MRALRPPARSLRVLREASRGVPGVPVSCLSGSVGVVMTLRLWAAPGRAGDCEHPVAIVSETTGLELAVVRCKQRRASRCATCGERHRRDVSRVARSGWLDRDDVVRAFFVTLTAPGADVLPWDKGWCRHRPGVRCSGKLGCRARHDELLPWNDSLGQRWSWMMTYIRREFPHVDVQFFKAVEPQRRGALHDARRRRAPLRRRRFLT